MDELKVPSLTELYAEVKEAKEGHHPNSPTAALLTRVEAYLAARVTIEDASRKLIEKGF